MLEGIVQGEAVRFTVLQELLIPNTTANPATQTICNLHSIQYDCHRLI